MRTYDIIAESTCNINCMHLNVCACACLPCNRMLASLCACASVSKAVCVYVCMYVNSFECVSAFRKHLFGKWKKAKVHLPTPRQISWVFTEYIRSMRIHTYVYMYVSEYILVGPMCDSLSIELITKQNART